MAIYYNAYRGQDWDSGSIKAALIKDTYTPSQAHDFYDDVNSHLCTGTNVSPATLGTKTRSLSDGVIRLGAATLTWSSVTTTDLAYIVLFDDSGTASTSPLIGWLDVRDNGNSRDLTNANISIAWSSGGILVVEHI